MQAQVAIVSDATVAWPLTEKDRAEVDHAVDGLLAKELTVDSAVQVALLNNRALRATFEELGLSQADLAAASRLSNPSLSFYVRWPPDRPRGPHWEFNLSADVLDAVLLPLRKRLAADQVAATEKRVAHEVLDLITEVKSAAFTYLAQQRLRERLGVIAAVNNAAADFAQRQFDAGNINHLELLQLQTAAQQSELEIARTDAGLRADREHLNRLLGLRGTQTSWGFGVGLPELPAAEANLGGLEELALDRRLDLAAAQRSTATAEAALRLKRNTRFLPASINLGGTAERESDGAKSHGPSIGLELPIFDQGQADVMRLEANWRQARARAEGLAIDIQSDVRATRDALVTARNAAEYYAQVLLPQRKQILRETLLQYNAMQKSNYELLAAKAEEQRAEQESIETLRDYWIARAELERAVGARLPTAPNEYASDEPTPVLTAEEPAPAAEHDHHHHQ